MSRLHVEVGGGTGMVITAAEVVGGADDHGQLVPMLKEAEATVRAQGAEGRPLPRQALEVGPICGQLTSQTEP